MTTSSDALIEVTLLTGFLGSGKTTLLKRILSWQGDLAGVVVLVNEFGQVGLDGRLLGDSGANIIEMTSGCVCCSLQADLHATLVDLVALKPRHLLIEATGVAKPSQVAQALEHEKLTPHYRLGRIITVLDATLWEAREAMGTLFWDQLNQAGLILLNKIDLLSSEEAAQCLEEIGAELPGKTVISTSYCDAGPEIVLATQAAPAGQPAASHLGLSAGAEAHYESLLFSSDAPLSRARLQEFLDQVPPNLHRIKGVVRFGEGMMLLNFTPGQAQWEPLPDIEPTRLVMIGQELDKAKILDQLQGCEAPA